jgi:hypothetical protein
MIICVDIRGGPNGFSNHGARYVLNIDEALQLARRELQTATWLTFKPIPVWGAENNFDSRIKPPS